MLSQRISELICNFNYASIFLNQDIENGSECEHKILYLV